MKEREKAVSRAPELDNISPKVEHDQPASRRLESQHSPEETVGLSIRVFDEDGVFDEGTRFELLFNQQTIATAGIESDGTLLFPIQLDGSTGLTLRKTEERCSTGRSLDGPKGPQVSRWPGLSP